MYDVIVAGVRVPVPRPDRAALIREFVAKHVLPVPGALLPFGEFYERFLDWSGVYSSRYVVSRALPPEHRTGRWNGNVKYLVNSAWELCDPSEPWIVTTNRRIWRPNQKENQ